MGIVSIPGDITPTEAIYAHEQGADFVKLFPAGNIGIDDIKALCGPLNHIEFLGVGGIDPENIESFMEVGLIGIGWEVIWLIKMRLARVTLIKSQKQLKNI